jgi:hypothetical protein
MCFWGCPAATKRFRAFGPRAKLFYERGTLPRGLYLTMLRCSDLHPCGPAEYSITMEVSCVYPQFPPATIRNDTVTTNVTGACL